jgi:hypothetical protein
MDEGMGTTTVDSSGYGNNGVLTGMTWAEGKLKNGLQGGSSVYMNAGTGDSLNMNTSDFSVLAWIVRDVSSNVLLRKGGGYSTSVPGYSITATNFQMGSFNKVILNGVVGGTIPSDNWSHLAYTIDRSGDVIKYINGIMTGSTDISADVDENIDSISSLIIGASNVQSWYGKIDELRIYSRVLSVSEIKAIYEGTK